MSSWSFFWFSFWYSFLHFLVLALFTCSDTELDLDQKKGVNSTICHFSIELKQHRCIQFCKKDLLHAYNTVHQYGMNCLLEFYLDVFASSEIRLRTKIIVAIYSTK